MLSRKDMMIVTHLRNNARETLTTISKKTNIPISTIYDKLKTHQKGLIKKYVSLIDFNSLGYTTRAHIMIKVEKPSRDSFREYVTKHQSVNSVFKINNGYDYLVEGIFRHIKELEEFIELLEGKFTVLSTQVHYIVEDIKQEGFMSDPIMMDIVGS